MNEKSEIQRTSTRMLIEKVKTEIEAAMEQTIFTSGSEMSETIKEALNQLGSRIDLPIPFQVECKFDGNPDYLNAQILFKPNRTVETIILNVTVRTEVSPRSVVMIRKSQAECHIFETCTRRDIYSPEYVPMFVAFGDEVCDWIIFDLDGEIIKEAGVPFVTGPLSELIENATVTETNYKLVPRKRLK